MQALILAAGQSSRFYPLTNGKHKCMIKLLGKPILEHTIKKLRKENILDIILVVDSKERILSYFGDGKKFGVNITYVIQKEPLGAGNAILLSKDFIKGDFLLLYPYHIDADKFIEDLVSAKKTENSASILIEEREETWKYGVAKISGNKLEELIEKPKKGEESSKFCSVGLYIFPEIFINTLSETPPEHYQLEKAITSFAKNKDIFVVKAIEPTITFKYPWDLLSFKNFLFESLKTSISEKTKIANSAEIIGDVVIEEGVEVMEGARIKGPCYIGKNVFIGNNVILRNGVDVEENSVIGANMEVKNSVIMENSKTHSGFIGDSVIGSDSRIGTQFCTANVRLDRTTVKTVVKGEKIDTGLKFLGVITGKNIKMGVKSSTMPGILIGDNAIIGPSTTVSQNIENDTKYYSKFQEIVSKHE